MPYCKTCGEEVPESNIYCQNCGENLSENKEINETVSASVLETKAVMAVSGGGGNAPLLIRALICSVAFIGIIVAIVMPQLSAHQSKIYNAEAKSELKNAKNSCESFYADNARYPENLEEAHFVHKKDLKINYEKINEWTFVIVSSHSKGDKIYKITSDSNDITVRDANDEGAPFTPAR